MSKEFTRGARYVVLKNADIMQCLTVNELIQLRYIQARVGEHRAKLGKPRLDCVVVESDWPEYEPTWNAIEMRMTGSLKESAVQTATRIMNIELIRERDDLRAENDELRAKIEQSGPDGFAWPECPKRRQSHVLFDDGYEEGRAACVATIKAAWKSEGQSA